MAGISSLYIATSGIQAAQAGLYVTGHNMANVDTVGYSRQRTLQSNSYYQTVGFQSNGKMQAGLGVEIGQINQIRDQYLDYTYRQEASKLNFYSEKYGVGIEIEEVMGELQSDYRAQSIMQDLWDSINEMHLDPTGVDKRGTFISTAQTFVKKVNDVYQGLLDEQYRLNDEIIGAVSEINNHLEEIKKLNLAISTVEASGDRANDYRDTRNNHIDELSKLLDITYKEDVRTGMINIYCDNNSLLVDQSVNKLGLRYTSAESPFVEPVFTTSTDIMPYEPFSEEYQKTDALFDFTIPISPLKANDAGALKAMLLSRGTKPANYSSKPEQEPDRNDFTEQRDYEIACKEYEKDLFNATVAVIPKFQREFDTMVNRIVTMVNDTFAPAATTNDTSAPQGLDGTQHTEIFVRKYKDRYDENGDIIPEDENDYYSLYTIGNIEVNPIFDHPSQYDKIAVSREGDVSDNALLLDMLSKWKNDAISIDGSPTMSVENFYKRMVTNIGTEMNEARTAVSAYNDTTMQADERRMQLSGVAIDEELNNMLKYQHAFNAASRVFNVIDGMLDKLINGTGRVGL